MKSNPENEINETTESPEQLKGFGVELSLSSELETLKDRLGNLEGAVNHDSPIGENDLESLGSALNRMKVEIGGEMMLVEEAEKIPDLKRNMEIWEEIKKGNMENVRRLTFTPPQIESKINELIFNNIRAGEFTKDGIGYHTSLLTKITPEISRLIFANRDKMIGGIWLNGLTSAEGLIIPKNYDGGLSLEGLTSAEDLVLPEQIWDLSLRSLTSAKGLKLPKKFKFYLNLNSLTSVEDLVLPESIPGWLFVRNLPPAEIEKLLIKYPRYKGNIRQDSH